VILVLNISQREGGSVMNDNIEFISYTGLTKYLCETVNNIKDPQLLKHCISMNW
jgi:hypothetical protein